ncbi:MAG TPA: hypothetical protein VH562_05325 [Nitrosopumilaceae archaeon]
MKKFLACALIGIIVIHLMTIQDSFGHGLNSETLPAVKIGNKEVALFAQIIPNPFIDGKQLGIELFDTATNIPIQKTTYLVKAIKNEKTIFENSFQRDDIGLVIDLIPKESGETEVDETDEVSKLESLLGIDEVVKVSSPTFKENGLYLFEVKILTIDSFENKLKEPIVYNFGLSFPDEKYLDLEDSKLGNNKIRLISFYDKINDFNYNPENNHFNFVIPFDWSTQTINQTVTVHEEFIFNKDFKYLMNANFSAYVNGVMLDDRTLTVDDYSSYKQRIIHIVINQSDLLELLEQNKNTKKMEFVLVPTNSVQKIAEYSIPQWIKNNAKWWSEDQIDDKTFASGIEFLIKEGIILVPETKPEGSTGKDIPSWIKNNAKWWADGLISDEDFVKGIQYLVEQEIIKVN